MKYVPEFGDLDDILTGALMRAEVRMKAEQGARLAQTLAPKKSGEFAASIHAEDNGNVTVTNAYGHTSKRAAAAIVTTDPKALTVEEGGHIRYKSGENFTGHHVLERTADIMNAE